MLLFSSGRCAFELPAHTELQRQRWTEPPVVRDIGVPGGVLELSIGISEGNRTRRGNAEEEVGDVRPRGGSVNVNEPRGLDGDSSWRPSRRRAHRRHVNCDGRGSTGLGPVRLLVSLRGKAGTRVAEPRDRRKLQRRRPPVRRRLIVPRMPASRHFGSIGENGVGAVW